SAFGFSVHIREDLIIVGAPWDDRLEGDGGAAYVYRFDQTEWELESALLPPRFSNHAGFSVRIGGSTALVGASDTGSEGTVFAYEFNGSQWRLDQTIPPPQRIGQANFGYAMDFEDDRLVIGAYGAFDHRGVAYLFERQGGGDWSPLIRFDPFDVHDTVGAPPFFGDACAVSGDLIVIGAPYEDTDHGGDSGVVYAFRHECGEDCAGSERIRKLVCDSGNLTVKLVDGIPGDAFEALLATGEAIEGTLNRRGKATIRFSGLPNEAGDVDVSWGCGEQENAAFFCP
ncbi:MAG: FG-GAP repeat protein, partial [Chloroflexi bacterium]|nr:FG-GAP repeat protein [Chloroflexota bacterium]